MPTIKNVNDIISYYKRNIILPKATGDEVLVLLLHTMTSIYIRYARLPTKSDSVTMSNLHCGSTSIQSCGVIRARPDIRGDQPYKLPILIKDKGMFNETQHRKLCDFFGNITSQLGRNAHHPWEAFMVSFMDKEFMGVHGDYGGKKSDDFFMMRLAMGVGGERTIKFEAMKLKKGAKNDRDGKVVREINFSVCLKGGLNAYLMSPYASGKNLLCWIDDNYTGLRGRHSSQGNGTNSAIFVIDFPLDSLKKVYLALHKFENMTIELPE